MTSIEACAARLALALVAYFVVIGLCSVLSIKLGMWAIAFGALFGVWAGLSKAFEARK